MTRRTAEELAYFETFEPAFTSSCSVGQMVRVPDGTEIVVSYCGSDPMTGSANFCPRPQTRYRSVYADSLSVIPGNDTDALARHARSRIPPEGAEQVHSYLLEALDSERAQAADLVSKMQAVCAANRALQATIDTRVPVETTDSYFVEFAPPIGPAVEWDSRNGLSIQPEFGVNVSYAGRDLGSLTGGYRPPPGITRLIVRLGDRERHFRFDRAFHFTLPAGYAYDVSFEGDDVLLISVRET